MLRYENVVPLLAATFNYEITFLDTNYVDNMLELEEKVSLLPPENLVDGSHKNQLVHINVLPKNIVPGSKLYIPISLNTSHWRVMRSQGLNGIKIR